MAKNNTLTILALLLLLFAFAYPYIFSASPEAAAVPTPVDNSQALSQLNSVSMDLSILQNKILLSLKSLSLPPLELPIGKPDPFK